MWKHYETYNNGSLIRRCDVCNKAMWGWQGYWSRQGNTYRRLCNVHYNDLRMKESMTSDFNYVYAMYGRKVG